MKDVDTSAVVFMQPDGFSLLEISLVVVIIGVLGVLSTPSLISFYQKIQLENALLRLRGAIRETQLQAIRLNQSCSLVVRPGLNQTVTGNCLLTGDRQFKGVQIQHSLSDQSAPWTITFDYKGRNQNFDDRGTVVLSIPERSKLIPKCLVMSIGIGLHRVGQYEGSFDKIVGGSCLTT